jgi:hypothetical protein
VFLVPYGYGFPDCPMYALLQVLHFNLYTPMGLFWAGFLVNCWYVVFVARKATLRLDCLKKVVTFLISGLWYVKTTNFLLC